MSSPQRFEIICYLDWCGAEAAFRFGSREQYDAARNFLDTLSRDRIGAKSPVAFRRSRTNFYFIDSKDRETFQGFMQRTASRAD